MSDLCEYAIVAYFHIRRIFGVYTARILKKMPHKTDRPSDITTTHSKRHLWCICGIMIMYIMCTLQLSCH